MYKFNKTKKIHNVIVFIIPMKVKIRKPYNIIAIKRPEAGMYLDQKYDYSTAINKDVPLSGLGMSEIQSHCHNDNKC